MAPQRVRTLFGRNCGHFSRFRRCKGGHCAKTAIDIGHLGERSYRRIESFLEKRFTPARHAGGHWFKSSTAQTLLLQDLQRLLIPSYCLQTMGVDTFRRHERLFHHWAL
jgi:hypothetical protein